jgi:ABC-type antimicrobial peptide transport system permease subunit
VIAGAGLLAGLAGTALLTRWLRAMVFGVAPLDPLTLTAVPLLFALLGTIAALVPARRATRINPVTALRGD